MPDSEAAKPPAKQGDTPKEPVRSRVIQYIKRKIEERRTKDAQEKPEDRAARRTATATVWIAIFTVLLALVGLITLREVIGGSSDTHELAVQAKRQADRMKNMSDAADEIRQAAQGMVIQEHRIADNAEKSMRATIAQSQHSLNASTEEFRTEHRAWVSLDHVTFIRRDSDGVDREVSLRQILPNDIISINVEWRNLGGTPALNVRPQIHFGTSPDLTRLSPGTKPSILLPGQFTVQTLGSSVPMDIGTLGHIISGQVVFYVWGRVDYQDVFNFSHWSTFCVWLTTGGGWAACQQGNKIDTNPELRGAN